MCNRRVALKTCRMGRWVRMPMATTIQSELDTTRAEVRRGVPLPLGIQILAAANALSVAAAHACGFLGFIQHSNSPSP